MSVQPSTDPWDRQTLEKKELSDLKSLTGNSEDSKIMTKFYIFGLNDLISQYFIWKVKNKSDQFFIKNLSILETFYLPLIKRQEQLNHQNIFSSVELFVLSWAFRVWLLPLLVYDIVHLFFAAGFPPLIHFEPEKKIVQIFNITSLFSSN